MEKEKIIANVIADLFEMRAAVNHPLQAGRSERIFNVVQYNFFNAAINSLMDKYKIDNEMIEDVFRERERKITQL